MLLLHKPDSYSCFRQLANLLEGSCLLYFFKLSDSHVEARLDMYDRV